MKRDKLATCKCVCRLTEAVCNAKQIWNKDKCQCECKEDLINYCAIKGIFGILVLYLANVINYAMSVNI